MEMSITEKELIEYGFVKNEGGAGLLFPYGKTVFEEVELCVTFLRNESEFCLRTPDGVVFLHVNNLDELKIIEQSITGYEEN